jgi:hypothetical protein
MTPAQQSAMRAGKIRAQQQRVGEAIEKVRRYLLWTANGSDPRTIPEVPSSAEFRMARGRQG